MFDAVPSSVIELRPADIRAQGIHLLHLSDIFVSSKNLATSIKLSLEMGFYHTVSLCEGGKPFGQDIVALPPVPCVVAEIKVA